MHTTQRAAKSHTSQSVAHSNPLRNSAVRRADNSSQSARLAQLKALADQVTQSPRQLAQLNALQRIEQGAPLQGKFETVQRQEPEEEEPLQGKFETVQRAALEQEEPLQGKFEVAQREELEEEEPLQAKAAVVQCEGGVPINDDRALEQEADVMGAQAMQHKIDDTAVQRQESDAKPNQTGLPDQLKAGVEHLSGISLDNVRVHTNSSQPAQLNALAYTQGTDIHVAPGQEQHLPHEAWHVAQQAQGRVQPTRQMKK